jgi:hypothetical protein
MSLDPLQQLKMNMTLGVIPSCALAETIDGHEDVVP